MTDPHYTDAITGPLSMDETARAVGLSYDRFRKIWRGMVADGFPRPFRARSWDAEAVRAWKARRSFAEPDTLPTGRAARARLQLERLREDA